MIDFKKKIKKVTLGLNISSILVAVIVLGVLLVLNVSKIVDEAKDVGRNQGLDIDRISSMNINKEQAYKSISEDLLETNLILLDMTNSAIDVGYSILGLLLVVGIFNLICSRNQAKARQLPDRLDDNQPHAKKKSEREI